MLKNSNLPSSSPKSIYSSIFHFLKKNLSITFNANWSTYKSFRFIFQGGERFRRRTTVSGRIVLPLTQNRKHEMDSKPKRSGSPPLISRSEPTRYWEKDDYWK